MEVGIVVMAPVPASVIGPYLAGAQKDLVTTALGYARVWATAGQGIVVEVVPDPDRDALHVRFALSGVAASVYVFLASHLQTQHPDRDDAGGRANTAWVDPAGRLNAWGEGRYLCLAAGVVPVRMLCLQVRREEHVH